MPKSMARWAASDLKSKAMKAVMVTLTFDGMPSDWSAKDCQLAFNAFMTRFKRAYWCRDYLVCRELQDRGVYHYHMVVLGVSFLPFAEIEAMWSHGFVWLTAYDDPSRAMRYVLKYVNKGGRLHASIHLLESLGIRAGVKAWRAMWYVHLKLRDMLMCHRITVEEHHAMYQELVVGCG